MKLIDDMYFLYVRNVNIEIDGLWSYEIVERFQVRAIIMFIFFEKQTKFILKHLRVV